MPIPQLMLWLFIAAWCVAVAAYIYAGRYFLPMWAAGFKNNSRHKGYRLRVLIGVCIFLAACAAGFAAGAIAEQAGGWG